MNDDLIKKPKITITIKIGEESYGWIINFNTPFNPYVIGQAVLLLEKCKQLLLNLEDIAKPIIKIHGEKIEDEHRK